MYTLFLEYTNMHLLCLNKQPLIVTVCKYSTTHMYIDSDYIDDEMKLCNVAIVTGDTGIGKTSIVHGMAKHLGFKVIPRTDN